MKIEIPVKAIRKAMNISQAAFGQKFTPPVSGRTVRYWESETVHKDPSGAHSLQILEMFFKYKNEIDTDEITNNVMEQIEPLFEENNKKVIAYMAKNYHLPAFTNKLDQKKLFKQDVLNVLKGYFKELKKSS